MRGSIFTFANIIFNLANLHTHIHIDIYAHRRTKIIACVMRSVRSIAASKQRERKAAAAAAVAVKKMGEKRVRENNEPMRSHQSCQK